MFEILKKEEVNIGRQYNLDLLKALAIICMIICHAVMQLASHIEGYETDFAYIFADDIFGSYVAVAHAFMFAMGVGFMYSKKNTPAALFKRGIRIYILGYVLNFFRYTIYILIDILIEGIVRPELAYSLYCQDILQFAGLAMMLTALFRKLKFDETVVFGISVVMSAIGGAVAFVSTGHVATDVLLGTFITTTEDCSCFTLFNWYIFVAAGMMFGKILRRLEKEQEPVFYRKILIVSGIVMTVYIVLTAKFGMYFLSKNRAYFSTSLAEDIGFMSIDLFILSVFYFLLKAVNPDRFRIFYTMSKNVNQIYIIHWCLLGFIDSIFCYLFGITFSYPVMYLIGAGLIVVSYCLADWWSTVNSNAILKRHRKN